MVKRMQQVITWAAVSYTHLDVYKRQDEDIEKINEIAAKHRLSICSISSPIFKCSIDNREELKEHFQIAKKCMELALSLIHI